MNAATLLNELYARDVTLLVVGPDRLRCEAKGHSLSKEDLLNLRAHKLTILAILRRERSSTKFLGRPCPFCHDVGMKIEETWKDGLHYFDTLCGSCGEVVETFVPANCDDQPEHLSFIG